LLRAEAHVHCDKVAVSKDTLDGEDAIGIRLCGLHHRVGECVHAGWEEWVVMLAARGKNRIPSFVFPAAASRRNSTAAFL
jgi:hypothetical protein